MSKRKFKWDGALYPAERVVLYMWLLSLALFSILGVSLRQPLRFYSEQVFTALIGYPFALFVCAIVVFAANGVRSRMRGERPDEAAAWRTFREAYFNLHSIVRDLRLMNAVMLMFVAFAQLKHVIFLINPVIWDAPLHSLESWIFGGVSPTVLLQRLIPGSYASYVSHGYTAYYSYLTILLFIVILDRRRNLAHEFCTTFCLMWLIGILMVYAAPTWGPCFFAPEVVSGLSASGVRDMQQELWKMKLFLDAHPRSDHGLYLISGQPSLHMAVAVMGSIYLRMIHPLLSAVSWLFVLVTLIATVYFGWHYLSDHVTALLLVAVSIAMARRMCAGSLAPLRA